MSEELKPCPFCGEENVVRRGLFASCPRCGSAGMAKGWNRRAEEEGPPLLPCPFCGAEPQVLWGLDGTPLIECERCGAMARVHGDTMAEAAAKWNRRSGMNENGECCEIDGCAPGRTCRIEMLCDDAYANELPPEYRYFRCSACGRRFTYWKYDPAGFCPKCGAKAVWE